MNDTLDKKYNLSKKFSSVVKKKKDYKERMAFYEDYYKKWYSLVNDAQEEYADEAFDERIFKFLPISRDGSAYLHSPSVKEILAFSKKFKKVYFSALPEITIKLPKNCHQLSYDDSYSIKIPKDILNTIDVAFSHHVVEHIYPEDLRDHLKFIYSLLKDDGCYIFVAPSRWMIAKDAISTKLRQIATNHHIGGYGYRDIFLLASTIGFSTMYKPFINPRLVNNWVLYKMQWPDRVFDILKDYTPESLGSLFCINSLYIKLKK